MGDQADPNRGVKSRPSPKYFLEFGQVESFAMACTGKQQTCSEQSESTIHLIL